MGDIPKKYCPYDEKREVKVDQGRKLNLVLQELNNSIQADIFYFELDETNKNVKSVVNTTKKSIFNLYIRNKKEKIGYLVPEEKIFYNMLDTEIQGIVYEMKKVLREMDKIQNFINIHEKKAKDCTRNMIVAQIKRKKVRKLKSKIETLSKDGEVFRNELNQKEVDLHALNKMRIETDKLIKELANHGIIEKKFWMVNAKKQKIHLTDSKEGVKT